MEKWDVVLVVAALTSLFATVIGPIVKLTRAITRLTAAMENIERSVADLTGDNHDAHERLWTREREQDMQLCDHESRLRVVEDGRKTTRRKENE